MDGRWRIKLLGSLQATRADRTLTRWRARRYARLLAYLAYHRDRAHSRDALVELVWPEWAPAEGRKRLAEALRSLRRQLEPPGMPAGAVIVADRSWVRLSPDGVTTDVAEFHEALARAEAAGSPIEQGHWWRQAIELYRGELLTGEDAAWVLQERQWLAERYFQALERLLAHLEHAGEVSRAIEYARRGVSADPLREEAHRILMRLYIAAGQPGAACRQYQQLEEILRRELDTTPESTTRALAQNAARLNSEAAQRAGDPAQRNPHRYCAVAPPPPVPTGTVTVLAIDLLEPAGSPEQDPGQFTGTTRGQSQIYCLFRQHRGVVMQDLESGFLVAFSHAPDGLACAVAIQHAMAEDWNPFQECGEQPAIVHEEGHSRCSPPTLARIALCTGSVEFRDRACQGTAVTDATRLLVAGNRGQILCSEVTAGLLRREIDPGLSLVDLGFHCLHDGVAPERLFQVDYPGMTFGQFPPPNAVRASSSSLPPQFNRFFGREEEIHTLCDLLLPAVKDADGPPEHAAEAWNAGTLPARLVTLTGPGGSGKTRLALEVANRLQVAFDGAVWLVPLAKLTEPGLIPITVRDALRLPRSPHVDVLDQVVTALSHRPSLLLLDNFEQLLIEGAAVVQALMERVEGLMVLATSRRRLGLPGEREVPVPPLPTPNRDLPPEQLVRCESVQLFVDRAQAVRSDFQVTRVNAPAVAALCARLDGIPLALELAAARAQVLTPAQMLARLERRFQLLVNHKQEPDARHQSLEAALDWSYELLSPELQRFFVRLSVFRGGWTLAAAHAVCDVESEGLALDCVQRLVDDSLILVGEERDEMRFRMLETVQEYAAQRLCEGERLEAARRHLGYYLALAEQAEPELRGPTQQQWFERLDREHENLEAALAWGVEHQDLKATLRLVRVLTPFWRTRGYFPPLREELFNLASSPDAFACSPALAAAVLSNLAWYRGTDEGARVLQEKILAIRRELGDREGIAHSLQALGNLAEEQGDYSAAHAFFGESLTIWRELGDPKGIADLLHCVGLLAQQQSDYRTARASYEESLAIRRTLGDRNSIAASLHRLGNLAEEQGDYERARSLQEQCLATRRELGYKDGVAYSLYSLALVAFRQGDYLRAQMLFEESLEIRRATRNPHGTAMSLWGLGLVGQQQCDCAAARSFFEESLEIRRRSGDRRGVALSLWGLGRVAQRQGNHVTAQARLGESLTIARDLGVKRDIAQNIEGLAATALAQCQTARAVRLFAAAEALRSTIGAPASPVDAAEYGHGMTTARVRLGDEAFDAARAEGQAMTLEEVICAALADSEIATLGEG